MGQPRIDFLIIRVV